MKSIIKKVLREEHVPTETEPLYLELPKNLVNKLGFKLFGNQDVVYIYMKFILTLKMFYLFFFINFPLVKKYGMVIAELFL